MILDELCCVSEMSDVTRNNLFPSPEEVTALSLQLALPATAGLSDNGRVTHKTAILWGSLNQLLCGSSM